MPTIPPPPRDPPLEIVDPAEFVALRAIVMALAAVIATQNERSGGMPAQNWINNVAVACGDVIRRATVNMSDPNGFRIKAMDYVNLILGGIRFPKDSRTN